MRSFLFGLTTFWLLCSGGWADPQVVPFKYLPGSQDGLIQSHLFSVPVRLGESYQTRFILDTGIGVDLISSKLAQRLGCPKTGISYRGQRMSGQSLEVPLSWLPGLTLGPVERKFVTCGVWDFQGFLPDTPEFAEIEGFLSLRSLQHIPFTIDYGSRQLILETPATLEQRLAEGTVVEVELDDDQGVCLTAFARLKLQGAGVARVEVDTGSDSLILHRRFMAPLGLSPESNRVKTVRGSDETGHAFVRYFADLKSPIWLGGQASLERSETRVMFQEIIYDGLIGHDFLKDYLVTYDLPHSRLILRRP